MKSERKRSRKQKRMAELEVTALNSLTLMATSSILCLGQNSARPLNHRKIAAKPADLQGIIWYRGRPSARRAYDGGITHA